MPGQKLTRTLYNDPYSVGGTAPRTGDVARVEDRVDMDMYYRPLEQVHGSGGHEWGVANGLAVRVTIGSSGVHVLAGVGIDLVGRHISLAATGEAEIGPNADALGAAPTLVTVDAVNGASLPTTGPAGHYYVTIQWWETFDTDGYNLNGTYRNDHTPWIRLVLAATFTNDGTSLVLASVNLDASGKVTSIDAGLRQGTGAPVQNVHLQKGAVSGTSTMNVPYGAISPLATGGVSINVPNAADEIHLEKASGGTLAKVALAANNIVSRDGAGRETVRIDTASANLIVGTTGAEGDILVMDGSNQLTVAINGATGRVYAGHTGTPGQLITKDGSSRNSVIVDGGLSRVTAGVEGGHAGSFIATDGKGTTTINLDGGPGNVRFSGKLKDLNNSYGGIGHAELKALISKHNIDLHSHVQGNATRPWIWHFWSGGGTNTKTLSIENKWGGPMQVFAFIAVTAVDSGDLSVSIWGFDFDAATVGSLQVDISSVTKDDGSVIAPGAPCYEGVAKSITFRIVAQNGWAGEALAVVFVER